MAGSFCMTVAAVLTISTAVALPSRVGPGPVESLNSHDDFRAEALNPVALTLAGLYGFTAAVIGNQLDARIARHGKPKISDLPRQGPPPPPSPSMTLEEVFREARLHMQEDGAILMCVHMKVTNIRAEAWRKCKADIEHLLQ